MKFSDLPQGYFVVISKEDTAVLLVKDNNGCVRDMNYNFLSDHNIMPDTEVQQLVLKKKTS